MQEKRKIAVLSNVNMNFVVRMLGREFSVYEAEGYGNELAHLLNKASSYYEFQPEMTFFVMDLLELLGHQVPEGVSGRDQVGYEKMEQWFSVLESQLVSNHVYYISDGFIWGPDTEYLLSPAGKLKAESYWLGLLLKLQEKHSNVRIFPYRQIIETLGVKAAFSPKTWYLGRILHSAEAQKQIGEEIKRRVEMEFRTPKKVLVLDLDNTLWGGLAGENDHTPVQLSDEHQGLAYKNEQRVIRYMKENGVILAIVSKNNEEDALEIIGSHPHMVLQENDFAARRINWNQKHENILEIAKELNLGTDSFVFWDDNPQERELVRTMLPEVAVPEFPDKCEDLPQAMSGLYRQYFEKAFLTAEDKEKTKQYQENAKRADLEKSTGSFEDYLTALNIEIFRVDGKENMNRLHQLVNKTNQFNLTTRRYELAQMQETVESPEKRVYAYRVSDCFGDYGIVAALIVDVSGPVPEVEEFAMSCRIMGKNVENALMHDVEEDLQRAGYEKLQGRYIPTAKNKPVAGLYEKLGYCVVEETKAGEKRYEIVLKECPKREYYGQIRA